MARDVYARAMAQSAIEIVNSSVSLKNNLTATTPPTKNDDSSKGYKASSIWIYNTTTYTCINDTVGGAVWASSASIYYFDTWSALVATISQSANTQYKGSYCNVANANNAPSAGITYTAPNTITNYIVDGGSAVFLINNVGTNYSTTTQAREIKNPVVTSVMLTPSNKPTTKGYYILTCVPLDGLPSGCGLNDILFYNGSTWSVWQSYSQANTVLVANTSSGTQVTWRKFNGTFMSTADEYIPDGKEYQTGKLWNGKAVYRKTYSGNLNGTASQTVASAGSIPMTGTILLIIGTFYRSSGTVVTVYNTLIFAVNSSGTVLAQNSDTAGNTGNFTCWVEYTKS